MLDHGHKCVDIVLVKAHAWSNIADHRHADLGVIARVALSDVVEQGADDEEVWTTDTIDQLGSVCRSFPEMPVNSEPVISVALRLRPNWFPLGQKTRQQ